MSTRWMALLLKLMADRDVEFADGTGTRIRRFYLTKEQRDQLREISGQDVLLWGLPVRDLP